MRLIVRNVLALSLVFVLVLAACQPATPAPTVTVRPTVTDAAVVDATAEVATEEATDAMEAPTEEATDAMMEPTEEATVEMAMDAPTEEATVEMAMDAPTEEATVEMAMDAATEEATEVMVEPTEEMTEEPTAVPTEVPTEEPTATTVPTEEPTATTVPTEVPTEEPTEEMTPEMVMEATEEATPEMAMDMTPEATMEATEAPGTEEMTIAEVVTGDENFSILLAAVSEAGLAEALSGEGPLTVFAPTNAAFEALLETLGVTAEELLAREDLASILLYHVVAGTVPAETLVTLIRSQDDNELVIKTLLEGQELAFTLGEDNSVIINGTVMVTVANIRTSNGIIHVIDAVLLPAAE